MKSTILAIFAVLMLSSVSQGDSLNTRFVSVESKLLNDVKVTCCVTDATNPAFRHACITCIANRLHITSQELELDKDLLKIRVSDGPTARDFSIPKNRLLIIFSINSYLSLDLDLSSLTRPGSSDLDIRTAALAILTSNTEGVEQAPAIRIAPPTPATHEIEIEFTGIIPDKDETFVFILGHGWSRSPSQFVLLGSLVNSSYVLVSCDKKTVPQTVVLQHIKTKKKEILKLGETRMLPE